MARRRIQMTVAWKQAVDRWLQDRGHDRSWLAAEIDVSPSTIKRMLEEQTSSEHVPAICSVTGLSPPIVELGHEDEHELLAAMRALTPDDREMIWAHIRRLRRGPKS